MKDWVVRVAALGQSDTVLSHSYIYMGRKCPSGWSESDLSALRRYYECERCGARLAIRWTGGGNKKLGRWRPSLTNLSVSNGSTFWVFSPNNFDCHQVIMERVLK